jgi:hypothetical protein
VAASSLPLRALGNLLLLSATTRLVGLTLRPFGLDEGRVWADGAISPTWSGIEHVWAALFGDTESALRAPAGLLGIASVFLAWALAKRLIGAAAAIWVAVLTAAGAFWIALSQEALPGSLLVAETLGLALLHLRRLDGGSRWWLVAWCLLSVTAIYTHPVAVGIVVAQAAHAALVSRRGMSIRDLLWSLAVAGLLAVLAILRFDAAVLVGRGDASGSGPIRLLESTWQTLVGPALSGDLWLVILTAILGFVPVLVGLRVLGLRSRAGSFLALSAGVPLLLLPLVGPVLSIHLVPAAPFLLILAVAGARGLPGVFRWVALTGLALVHLAGLVAWHGSHLPLVGPVLAAKGAGLEEDWRAARAWLAERAQPGDLVIVPAPFRAAWDYQDRGRLPTVSPPTRPDSLWTPTTKRILLLLARDSLADEAAWLSLLFREGVSGTRTAFDRGLRLVAYEVSK